MILLRHREGLPLAKYWRLGPSGPEVDEKRNSEAYSERLLGVVREYHPRVESPLPTLLNIHDYIAENMDRRDVCLVRLKRRNT